MIVRPRPGTLRLLFSFQSSIVRVVAFPVLLIFAVSCGVLAYSQLHPAAFKSLSATPFALFTIGISVFIGFRNTASYDRWYEARKAWGALLIETRSFTRTALTLLEIETARPIVEKTIAFTYALNAALRRQEMPAELDRYLTAADREEARLAGSAPNVVLEFLARDLAGALRRGEITDILYKALDEHLNAFAGVQGACERILNTPTPFTYVLLLHRATIGLCLLLPFSLVSTVGYVTPLICTLVAYSFLGIDALCDELEQPFGENPNALPLNALSRTIEIDLLQALHGETELEHHRPSSFVLS